MSAVVATPSQQATKPSSQRNNSRKDESHNPDLNATQIGNYVIQKTVGEGNFAKVKLAKHKLTGAEVAIKVIDKTTLDEKKLSKLYREIRIMKLLHHPNIVKLYEVIETKNTVFLVMEYASGGELYDYLVVHGKMKEKEARAKFRQILSAVSYCHKKRVIHRDLKAENLLLDENLNIKIADFGFSNTFDPENKLDTFCGSPPYAAPELFQGRRYTGPEVDIWSLGVILYVLTTGCLPFDGKNLQEMRESVCRGKYRIPFYLSDTCEKLLRKFLVRDPEKRSGLDMLIDDIWINEGFTDSPISTDVSTILDVDENIIRLIEQKYKIERDAIIDGINDNTYNDLTAIYYLLYYEKSMRENIEKEFANSPTHVLLESPATKHVRTDSQQPTPSRISPAGMQRIEEDSVLPNQAQPLEPKSVVVQQVPANYNQIRSTGSPRKRRFTVGGEAKYDPNESEEAPTQLPQQPQQQDSNDNKPITSKPIQTAMNAEFSGHTRAVSAAAYVQTSTSSQYPSVPENSQQESHTPQAIKPVEQPLISETRKRNNTISGIFRNMRRPSEVGARPNIEEIIKNDNNRDSTSSFGSKSIGAQEPRALRFTFNSNTTSSKPPDDIVLEVIAACEKFNIQYKSTARFLLECTSNSSKEGEILKFEIEICKLPRLKNLHGLRFKRLGGASTDYKDICEKLLGAISL